MKYLYKLSIVFLLLGILLIAGCAKMGTPTGGPKDEEYPLIVKIDPEFNTTNFDKEEINITFDEYIQLKDLNSSLVISPPLKEKPDIKVKGKTLNISFTCPLKDSTTYNIYFGNSVQDYNEGNPIENFQYVLSTGGYIDSLSVKGKVLNPFNLLPEKDVFVMLYNNLDDSVSLKEIPEYVSKTNEEGNFRINNIRYGDYKIFGLRDLNKNYIYDMPNEEIAFIDTLVKFELVREEVIDTLYKTDTAIITTEVVSPDSTKALLSPEIDTIITKVKMYYPVYEYVLMLFQEEKELQYLANSKRESKQKIELDFNKPIKDSVVLTLADTVIEHDWYIQEQSAKKDTIFYWLTDSTIYHNEKLTALLKYQKEDSNLVYQWNTDTLNLKFFELKKKKNQEADTLLKYKLNTKDRATFDLNKQLDFTFETPTEFYDTSRIKLFALVDTLEFPVEYNFIKNSSKLREFTMNVDWAEDTIYRLEIYPYAFVDIYGSTNDTSIIEFRTQKLNFYGKILANITGVDSSYQVIAQLILQEKEKETVYSETIIKEDKVVEFGFLPPKDFMFKVIIDKNFNNKWDTGEYLKHIHPEDVLYYKEKIKIRSNWDIEISFDLTKKLE